MSKVDMQFRTCLATSVSTCVDYTKCCSKCTCHIMRVYFITVYLELGRLCTTVVAQHDDKDTSAKSTTVIYRM